MLWAAFCLGFWGFLWAGEFTCPSQAALSSEMLMVDYVVIDSHEDPSHMMIRLKRSKTDLFGAGFTLHFGLTGDELCPITAVLGYLAWRPPDPGFLFLFRDGTPLSRAHLCHELRLSLMTAGVDTTGWYSGQSFRIGAATTAAQVGLTDSFILTLSRWKSAAFLYCYKYAYFTTEKRAQIGPTETLVSFSFFFKAFLETKLKFQFGSVGKGAQSGPTEILKATLKILVFLETNQNFSWFFFCLFFKWTL